MRKWLSVVIVAWAAMPVAALDNGIGLTPPLGYNAYGDHVPLVSAWQGCVKTDIFWCGCRSRGLLRKRNNHDGARSSPH